MGDGHHISPAKGGSVPPDLRNADKSADNRRAAPQDNQPPAPKENAAQLFDKKWHNAKANDLRNNLSSILTGGEKNLPKEHGRADKDENKYENRHQADASKNQSLRQPTEQPKTQTPKSPTDEAKNLLNKHQAEQTGNQSTGRQAGSPRNLLNKQPTEPAKNLLNKTWDTLVNAAKEHKDLAAFRDKPKQFWNDVRQMSELRVVESFVHGKMEPRAVSRYGELLKQFERQGGRLQDFLATLAPAERRIFQARYQINQTFGAGDLFAGKGIALDRRGDFPVRVFLSHNGKNVELPPHAIISLLNGGNFDGAMNDFSAADSALLDRHALFTNGGFLLNTKSAALLSLSLALYQNIHVTVSLTDVAAEMPPQHQSPGDFAPKTLNLPVDQSAARASTAAALENTANGETGGRRESDPNVAGALINGTFATIDKYRKGNYQPDGASDKSGASAAIYGFSAGATGAVLGATVGCIVPLAEKSVGEILGFAASVVVGLTDSGLRALGVNTLVSVVTTGAQIFLSASSNHRQNTLAEASAGSLNAAAPADFLEDELRQTIFDRRRTVLLAS